MAARFELHVHATDSGHSAQLFSGGQALTEAAPVDLAPSNVTEAILRQLQLEPAKRRLLPAAHVQGAGERLWQALGAVGDKLAEALDQGPVDLAIVSHDAQALRLPWEVLRAPDSASPVRSGALEILRSHEPLAVDQEAQGTLRLSLSSQVEDVDDWQLPLLQAIEPLVRRGKAQLSLSQGGGLSVAPREDELEGDLRLLREPQHAFTAGMSRTLGLQAPLDAVDETTWLESTLRALADGADLFQTLRAARAALSEAGAFAWMQPIAVVDAQVGPVRSPQAPPVEGGLRLAQIQSIRTALTLGQSISVQGPPPAAEELLATALRGMPHHRLEPWPEGLIDQAAMALGVRRGVGPGADRAYRQDLRAALQPKPILAVAPAPDSLVPELGALAALGGLLAVAAEHPCEGVEAERVVLGPLNPTELLRCKLQTPAFATMAPELWEAIVQVTDADHASLRLLPAWLQDHPERVSELQPGAELLPMVVQDLPQQLAVAWASAGGLDLPEAAWVTSPLPFQALRDAGLLRRSLKGWAPVDERPVSPPFLPLLPPADRALALLELSRGPEALQAATQACADMVAKSGAQGAIAFAQRLLRQIPLGSDTEREAAAGLMEILSDAHTQLGEHQMALAALENANAWAAASPDLQRKLGAARVRMGQLEAGRALLEPLVPEPEALLELALSYEAPEQRRPLLERALEQSPTPALEAEILGQLVPLQDSVSERVEVARRRLEIDPSPQALAALAAQLIASGASEEARALHQKRLSVADPVERSGAHLDLARMDLEAGEHGPALAHLESAWELALGRHRLDAIASVGGLLGQLLAGHDKTRAVEVLGRAQDAYQSLGQSEQAAQIAAMVEQVNQGASSATDAQTALAQARTSGDLPRVAGLQFQMAQQDLQQGDLDSAMQRLDESWGIVHRAEQDEGRSVVGLLYAQLLERAGKADQARAVSQAALLAAERLQQAEQIQRLNAVLNRLGQDPHDMLNAARERGDKPAMAALLFQLGSQELQSGEHAQASLRIAESFRLNLELNNPRGVGVVGALHGQLLMMQGQRSEARRVLEEALHAARQLGEPGLMEHLRGLLSQLG